MSLRGIRGIVSNWMNFKRIALAVMVKPPLIFVVRIWMKFSKNVASSVCSSLNKCYAKTLGEILKIIK